MKIYGLVNLKTLFVLDNFKSNFENAVNASYKASENGALSIIIKGKLPDAMKIRTYLKDKMDIPVGIFVNSKLQYENALNDGISLIFSERKFPRAKEVLIPGNKNFLSTEGNNILIENRRLLKFFKETVDFLPEIVSAVSFRLSQLNYDCFITEEVLSAKKGLEISKYL